MAKVEDFLKDSYKLKEDFEKTVALIQDNETKYQGFKVVQYALLLSESLDEISDKPLRYLEDIFDIDRVVMFIRKGRYAISSSDIVERTRVYITDTDAFKYTFLEKRAYYATDQDVTIIHKDFRVYEASDGYSCTMIPILENDDIVGAIGFYSSDIERFSSKNNYDFVSELAVISSIALRKLDSSYMLALSNKTDYLTGLPSKAMIDHLADKWLLKTKASGTPFSFMLVDIDNFKSITDLQGHIESDETLHKLAMIIKRRLGVHDAIGRYSGDNFYIFCQTTSDLGVMEIVNSINTDYFEIAVETGLPQDIGVSVGYKVVTKDVAEKLSFVEIFKQTDTLLLAAKDSGDKGLCHE